VGKCANFMNQEAIDEALREANRQLGDEQYTPGSNCCVQCDYGLGRETSPMMAHLKQVAGHPIKRVCYKEKGKASV